MPSYHWCVPGNPVVDELVADRFPRLPAVVAARDRLAEPVVRLRSIDAVRIHRRCLHVVDLPAAEMRPADLPVPPGAVRRENEAALARADEKPYSAHDVSDLPRIYSSTFLASTSSGTLPPSTTVSLNAFTSNLAAERRRRLLALPVDLAMTHLVAARLSWPRAIAIDLAGDFLGVRSVHVDEESHALLARPALGVDARVDDQPARAEGNRLEISEPPDAIGFIGAKFVGQLLGIEPHPSE